MDEKLKTKVLIALGIVSAVLLIITVNSCNSLRAQEQKWRREMAQRLDSEEKAQKASQDEAAVSGELKKTRAALDENAKQLEAARKALLQEQMVNQNLKDELGRLSKLKDALEADLKQALANGGRPAKQPRK